MPRSRSISGTQGWPPRAPALKRVKKATPSCTKSRSTRKFQSFNMTTISKEANFLTLINIFTVDPTNQQTLLNLLTLATNSSVRKVPGFISSSLHRSIDGTKVTMYAQWRSIEDYQKMRNNSSVSPYLDEALKIAKFEPGMYEVVETFLPATD